VADTGHDFLSFAANAGQNTYIAEPGRDLANLYVSKVLITQEQDLMLDQRFIDSLTHLGR
jgi:hypothetical protein